MLIDAILRGSEKAFSGQQQQSGHQSRCRTQFVSPIYIILAQGCNLFLQFVMIFDI